MQRIVQVTMTRRIPVFLVIVSVVWTGEQGLLEDARIPRLIEGGDSKLLICVLLDNPKCILMRIERGHENERDVDALGSVKVLDLADSKIEECHVVFDLKCTFRTGHTCRRHRVQMRGFSKDGQMHTHGGTKATIDLKNGQFAESGRVLGLREGAVRHDLVVARGLDTVPVSVKVKSALIPSDDKKREPDNS